MRTVSATPLTPVFGADGGGEGGHRSVLVLVEARPSARCGAGALRRAGTPRTCTPEREEDPEELVPEEERQPAQARLVVGVAAHPHQRHDRYEQQHTGGDQHPGVGRWGGVSRVRA